MATDGPTTRVLVVDDEPAIRELIQTVLRYEGFEVATAADGRTRSPSWSASGRISSCST